MATTLSNAPLAPPGLPKKPARNTAAASSANATAHLSPPPIQQSLSSTSSSSLPSPSEDTSVKLSRAARPRTKGRPKTKYTKNQDKPHPQNNNTAHIDHLAFEQHNFSVRSCVTSPEPTTIRVKVPLAASLLPPAKTSSLSRVQPDPTLLPKPEGQLPPYSRQPETCWDWMKGKCDRPHCRYLHDFQPGSCLLWLRTGTCPKFYCEFRHAQPTVTCLDWSKGSCSRSLCPFLHGRQPESCVDVSKSSCKEPPPPSSHDQRPESCVDVSKSAHKESPPLSSQEQQAERFVDASKNARKEPALPCSQKDRQESCVDVSKSTRKEPPPRCSQEKQADSRVDVPKSARKGPPPPSSQEQRPERCVDVSKSARKELPPRSSHEQRPERCADVSRSTCKEPPLSSHEQRPERCADVSKSARKDPPPPCSQEKRSERSVDVSKSARKEPPPCSQEQRPENRVDVSRSACKEPPPPSSQKKQPERCVDVSKSARKDLPPLRSQEQRSENRVDVSKSASKEPPPSRSHEQKLPNSIDLSSKPDLHPSPLEERKPSLSVVDRSIDRCAISRIPPRPVVRPFTCQAWLRSICKRSPCPDLHTRQPETCAKWRQDICERFYCPFVHDVHVTCRDWMKGECNRPICHHAHATALPGPPVLERDKQALDKPNPTPSAGDKVPGMINGKRIGSNLPEPHRPPEPLYGTVIADHIKVRLDRGFEIREVTTGFESRWINLGNVKSGVSSSAINELLSQYGQVDPVHVPESTTKKSLVIRAQFSSPAEAMKAATALHGQEFHGQPLTARVAINNFNKGNMVVTDTDVCVTWQSPHVMGYAGYATLKGARAVMDFVANTQIKDSLVTADLYDGLPAVGAYNVVFRYLPAETTEKDIRRLGGDVESIMLERPNYKSIDRALQTLHSILENHGTVISFDHLPPPYREGMAKAWVRFSSQAEARHAQECLDGQNFAFLGRTAISVRHVLSMSFTLPYSVYRNLQDDLTWLRRSWWQRYGPGITLSERGDTNGKVDGPVFIRVSCEDSLLLSHLKYQFEQLLRGDTVMFDKKPIWDDFLAGSAGLSFIKQLQQEYPGVEIRLHKQSRIVSVIGSITCRHAVKQEIVRKIVEIKSQQVWDIPLPGRTLGLFLSEGLARLQEAFSRENCYLNHTKRTLVIRGNEQTFRVACKAVQDVLSRQGVEPCQSDAICPVCFNDPVLPTFLACGHQWCRGCLTGYLVSAVDNKTFPLTCLGNDACCTERIPLSLSRELLTTAEFDAVVDAAFWTHVHSRPDEFHHCPVPDCNQIYRSAPRNTVLQCPSCLVRICPACHIEYHDGMTCEERDEADDKMFWQWRANKDVKDCPVCRVPIERSEGCNHMTCIRCQSHICWECLAVFPRGEGIYDHMRHKHGGIGL